MKTPDVVTEPLWRGDRPKSRPAAEEVTAVAPPPAPVAQVAPPPPAAEPAPIAPVEQALVELQRRVEELERSPNSVPPELRQRIDALKVRAHAPPPVPQAAPNLAGALVLPTYARATSAPPPPYVRATSAPPPALISVDDIDIDIDVPFDGRARRRRVVIRFILFVLVVFGGLVGAMIYSYSPRARVMLTR
jgi:hypothetical protein